VEILRHSTHLHRELPLIRHHHERVDGLGYPHGLAGQRIPLGARVLAVADALDTMLSRRSYKPPYCLGRATLELTRGCDRQFDRDVVAAALAWLRDDGDATATSLHCGATQPSDCPNPQVACESACFQ
jgi:HD-GYP domain-containing protein (c-di-GMP phosphodiesterase class II)